ncbi:MAG TPA: hypothetical protein VHK65_08105 [Candidatus Dormibacteraeota bacterium]|nr:hypothetical protein [Candidatus Dormibacteraeota bacterium]
MHPSVGLPLTFLCQIAVPSGVAGDGSWLVHIFIDVSFQTWADTMIVHPSG